MTSIFRQIVRTCFAGLLFAGMAYAQTSEVEPNNTSATATALTGFPRTLSAQIAPGGDFDYYTFTLPTASDIYVYTAVVDPSGPSQPDTVIDLMLADGVTVVVTDDDDGDGFMSALGRTLQAAGTYFIRVRPFNNNTTAVFNYTITFLAPTLQGFPLETEPNNLIPQSGTNPQPTLTCPGGGGTGDVIGTGTAPSDLDLWKFSVATNSLVYGLLIETKPTVRNTQFFILTSAGATFKGQGISTGNTALGTRVCAICPAGDYFFAVQSTSAVSVHYSVTYTCTPVTSTELEPNGTVAQANAITLPASLQSELNPGTDVDYYSFTLATQSLFSMRTGPSPNAQAGVLNTALALMNSTGTVTIASNANCEASVPSDESACIDNVILAPGTYLIQVTNGNTAFITGYTLTASATACVGSDVEPNDSTATAQALTLPASVSCASISPAADIDYYSFTLPCAETVTMRTGPAGSIADTRITLFDSTPTQIDTNDDCNGAFGDFSSCLTRALAAGTYFLKVEGFSAASVFTYNLSITAVDVTPPVLTCSNQTVECTSPAGANVTYTTTTVDACDPSPTLSCTPPSGSSFGFTPTTVNCSSSDHAAVPNTSTCSFTVTVVDTTPPTITSCPGTITRECTSPSGAVATYSATATDLCGTPTVVCSPLSGSTFPIGTTGVTCTATDASSNSSVCSFNVVVVDTTPPVLTPCPANITVATSNPGGRPVTYTPPTATDVCDAAPSVSCVPASGSNFPIGTTTVTCTATDGASNSTSCSFNVIVLNLTVRCVNSSNPLCNVSYPTIQDAINASVSGDIVIVGAGTYNGTVVVDRSITMLGEQQGISGCAASRPNVGNETILSDPLGPLQITADNVTVDGFIIRDADGTVAGSLGVGVHMTGATSGTLIQNCIVTQNTFGVYLNSNGAFASAVRNCKFDDNNVNGPASGNGIYSDQGLSNASIDHNCFTNNQNASIVLTGTATTNPYSNITIEHNKADNSFVAIQASSIIVRKNRIDNSIGSAIFLDDVNGADINCNNLFNGQARGVRLNNIFTGLASSNVTVHDNNIVGNALGGMIIGPGSYSAPTLDAENNWWGDASGPFNAANNPGGLGNEVSDDVDAYPFLLTPTLTLTCTSPVIAECTSPTGANVSFSPSGVSLCDPSPVVTCVPSSGSHFPFGDTTVNCSAIDDTCATASCSFTVRVVDTTAPVTTCPANITAECTSASGAPVTFTTTAVDICDASPTLVCTPPSGTTFSFGTTGVSCTGTDNFGNASTCSFSVTVQDTTAPVAHCPASFSAVCSGPSGASVPYSTTATDVCDPSPSVVCAPPSGSTFPIGATTVNCTATDNAANSSTCSFTITVVDINPPTITCSPNITAECTSPSGATVTYSTTAVDDCDTSPIISCVPASGSTFPIGVRTVNCTATDHSGNGATCSFSVTVRDTVAPNITCSANITRECTGPSGAAVTFTTTATDTCGTPTVTCVPSSGSTFAIGTTTVNCTARDAALNTSTCSFSVTVRDTVAPSITCSPNLTRECTSPAGTPVGFTVTSTDLCDSTPTIVCNPSSGSAFSLGTTTVNCTATDDSSNSTSCSFTVTVSDTIAPALSCPSTQSVCAQTPSGAVVSLAVSATDACDATPVVICNPPTGSTFPPGNTSVTCNAADGSGNTSTCSFVVHVNPGIATVLPPNGKETGNDLVTLTGAGFTNIGDTQVFIGPFTATVVFVDATHVRIRTARGFGLRDVTITNSFGSCTLPNSYQYLDPSIAARYGNVNVGQGDRFDVLTINGSAGDPALRELSIPVNTAIRVDMAAAPSRVRSAYALYVWPSTPNFSTVRGETLHGFDLGCMVLPSPLNSPDRPQPFKILNNTTIPEFGTPNINSFPAPVTVGQRANGLHTPRTLTLQGFIEDDASQAPAVNLAVTNAIILHITP